jgi:hypothetical protein
MVTVNCVTCMLCLACCHFEYGGIHHFIFLYRTFSLKVPYFAVTFGNEEASLGTQNHTFSRQIANGPVQLASSATEFRSDCCNSGFQAKRDYSKSQSLLEPEEWNTSSTTSELSRHQETHIYTPSSLHCFYAARLHLICLAVLVRIMLTVDYGFMFGEVSYAYVAVPESNSM